MKKETVGKIAYDLMQKEPDSRDPIEIEREVHKNYEAQIIACIEDGKKYYTEDFYIIVITKKERLMHNVLRNYFFHRQSCPTPDYDQTVYKYTISTENIEFLWVIPSKDTCILLKQNALEVVPEERQLLKYVLDFADGTLYKLSKKLNGEAEDSSLLVKE
jgi:hypothetical protein